MSFLRSFVLPLGQNRSLRRELNLSLESKATTTTLLEPLSSVLIKSFLMHINL